MGQVYKFPTRTPFSPRKALSVGLDEVLRAKLRIYLRRHNRPMAQHRLDELHIRPAPDHVRGEGVPEGVEAETPADAGAPDVILHALGDGGPGQPSPDPR